MVNSASLWILWAVFLHSGFAAGSLCTKWGEPLQQGFLERKEVPEASGAGASLKYPGRIYWINDSGNKDYLYYSSSNGKGVKKIRLQNTKFLDTEALAVTSCGEEFCVIIADIGNNSGKPRDAELNIFLEKDLNSDNAKVHRKVKFKWPSGQQDVEAMAVLPNGDILFISKEWSLGTMTEPTVFILSKKDWMDASIGELTAKDLGKLPVPKWMPDKGFLAIAVTDAAVNYEREVLGVLTYGGLIEMPLDRLSGLSVPGHVEPGRDFALVPIKVLVQQEAMLYLPKSPRVIWTSEFFPPRASIYAIECERTGF